MKIKRNFKFALTAALLMLVIAACSSSSNKKDTPVVWNTLEELVGQMTLEEKIGQMTQAERVDISNGDIKKYGIGSILSGGGSSPRSNTPQGWVEMINGYVQESLETRTGIPIIYGLDAVHGHAILRNAIVFPHNIGLGAIAVGNLEKGKEAAYTAGRITAQEMKASGSHWNFAPVLGVPDDIRWGRTYECFSENVEIVTAMGASAVKGLQDYGIAATMKHYLGEGQTENGRNQGNAKLDRAGIDRILPPYRAAVEAGALTLMPSFSSVNGVKMHEHTELLTNVLRGELGFEGFIISDWDAIKQLAGRTYRAQIASAINAGVDMVMATNGRNNWITFISTLTSLVNDGIIPMSRIDDAVLRILKVKQEIGLFDNPLTEKAGVIGKAEDRAEARAMVADSLVLLRNENNIISKLPEFKNILVAGDGSNNIGMQCGGWTITWQGAHGNITEGTTILGGIQEALKDKAAVTHSANGKTSGTFDAVIAVIGENPYAEGDGDRRDNINIRTSDEAMLKEVYSYNCPVIVIMLSGRPMTLRDEYLNWDAFIAAWLPGTEGAGIADVLFGDRDFTGRTPFTWRKTIGGDVLYPYGFGLTK